MVPFYVYRVLRMCIYLYKRLLVRTVPIELEDCSIGITNYIIPMYVVHFRFSNNVIIVIISYTVIVEL